MSKAKTENSTGVPEEFIVNIQGKDFVKFVGLLDLAHRQGLKQVKTQLIQTPSKENDTVAITHATVETEKGVFTGIGDANPANVHKKILPHIIRMSETRAIARAMRFATNVAMTAFEELGDLDSVIGAEHEAKRPSGNTGYNANNQNNNKPVPTATNNNNAVPNNSTNATNGTNGNGNGNGNGNANATNAQIKAIYNIGKVRGRTQEQIKHFVLQMFQLNVEHLDKTQASTVIREMQNNGGPHE